MGTEWIVVLIGGYVTAAVTVFLLFLPVLVLFSVLLLAAGILQVVALPFVHLFRRLRGRERSDHQPDGTRSLP